MKTLIRLFLLIVPLGLQAQIDTYWIDTTTHKFGDHSYFFTNRPLKVKSKKGILEFKNKTNKKTDNLYFCLFDYAQDTFLIKYRAKNSSNNYPVEKVENNIFYKIYDDLRIKKGIKKFSVVIPGYSHTFDDQIYKYMHRVKKTYADSVKHNMVHLLYAWSDEWRPYRYHSARTSAIRGAADFAIFQHMLEDFLSDSVFFSTHPKDITFYLTCSSMGNQLLKKYLIKREKQDIPFTKVYKHILFIGSDASWGSFEEGKGFDHLNELCDTVTVTWHDNDIPLKASKSLNFRKRMGLYGPRKPENLPGYIKVLDVGEFLVEEDKKGLWHDYLLTNPQLQQMILNGIKEDENVKP
ncbi:hypothetical protein [Carboxylicivirga sp. N1Y90]|uniref:hypothetical protein n=1 Tax=Carboxylicivirga fragile TaxID=3417571 RepID=UPI003D344156|nr:alpha/beta hydrolase [Marinilabiliaceae bacterium N1Y90]